MESNHALSTYLACTLWVAVESNHAPLSYQESVLADELATLLRRARSDRRSTNELDALFKIYLSIIQHSRQKLMCQLPQNSAYQRMIFRHSK